MENLDFLVKLASFGTAGVSVLAIFYIGFNIARLPNDAPEWKSKLMSKFISACVVIAITCAISGGVNAYFNRGKIVKAETRTKQVEAGYQKQLSKVMSERDAVKASLVSLRAALTQNQMLNPTVSKALDSTEVRVNRIQLVPKDQLRIGP
ncbi:MAG: hypothetical protein JSV52_05850 [Candidatus Zixiibacteriota bacterium]|nr:MAG: hypothetical protein JSV52_05850 [candidate division Zixibacteria bacterium]